MVYVPIVPTAQQIKVRLDADPNGLGYAAMEAAQSWDALAAAMNLVRPGAAFVVQRRAVQAQEFLEAIVYAELVANTAAIGTAMRDALTLLFLIVGTGGTIDAQHANIRAFFTGAFAAGTTTRANLQALQARQGSDAEVAWGDGVRVNSSQVEEAARLP